jgi:hypothetical protein
VPFETAFIPEDADGNHVPELPFDTSVEVKLVPELVETGMDGKLPLLIGITAFVPTTAALAGIKEVELSCMEGTELVFDKVHVIGLFQVVPFDEVAIFGFVVVLLHWADQNRPL